MALQRDEFYVRDVSGKEIAIYSSSSLTQWNIWGLDNVGKINADTTRNYYLKDHLGSIRVVLNSANTVISAQDYDCWGYPLENRIYNSSAMKYDFTGKERDDETSYDYFGARYYDSRIGRWGGVEPLLAKFINSSPYIYCLVNPIAVSDVNGMDVKPTGTGVEDMTSALSDYVSGKIGKEISIFMGDNGNLVADPKQIEGVTDQGVIDLFDVINKNDYNVNLVSNDNQAVYVGGTRINYWVGGQYGDVNGNTATQYISYGDVNYMEKIEHSDVGKSVMHEILEAYYLAKAGESNSVNFKVAHEKVKKNMGDTKADFITDYNNLFNDGNTYVYGIKKQGSKYIHYFYYKAQGSDVAVRIDEAEERVNK